MSKSLHNEPTYLGTPTPANWFPDGNVSSRDSRRDPTTQDHASQLKSPAIRALYAHSQSHIPDLVAQQRKLPLGAYEAASFPTGSDLLARLLTDALREDSPYVICCRHREGEGVGPGVRRGGDTLRSTSL